MARDIKFKDLENSAVEMTITLKSDEIEKAFTDLLAKYSKNVQIPGFRKGKVPASVIEKKYGDAIRQESTFNLMEQVVTENVKEAAEDKRPLPFSTPELQDEEKLIPFKPGKDIVFSVRYDVMPKFEAPEYKGIEVEVPNVKIEAKQIDEEIEKIRQQNAMVVDKKDKAIENGDVVTLDYEEVGKPDSKRDDYVFTVGSGYNFYKFDDDVIGMKKGDEKTFSKTYTEDSGVPGYEGKTIELKVKIKAVKVREVPELDDDLAQDVKSEYKTVADLKAGVKKQLEESLEERLKETKLEKLMSLLAEKTDIAIPQSMVDFEVESTWRRFASQSGMSEEQLLQFLQYQGQNKETFTSVWRPEAAKMVRQQLIMEKIAQALKYKATEKEIEEEFKTEYPTVKDEDKEQYKPMIEDALAFRNTRNFLLDNNKFTKAKKATSYEDFITGAYLEKKEEVKAEEKTEKKPAKKVAKSKK